MQQHDKRFLLLVTRKLAGEASAEELNELADMIRANPSLKEELILLQKYWEQKSQQQNAGTEVALKKIFQQIGLDETSRPVDAQHRTRPLHLFLRIAASLILLLALAIGGYRLLTTQDADNPSTDLVQKLNAKGVKSSIALSDGSKIWLNADSKIQYPAKFTGNTREVFLNGEAFFDVEKNPEKPFIIHLANGTIQVLGTSFNVKAYDDEEVVETSVATGKVAFIPRTKKKIQSDTIFLTPNKKVVYELKTEQATTSSTASEEDKAWIEGKLIFRSMLFEDIAIALERNFGKRVVFLDQETAGYRLTGSFENNTLPEILYYLAKTKFFHYKISDEQILISSRVIN